MKRIRAGRKEKLNAVKLFRLGGKLRISRFNQLEEDFENEGNSIREEKQVDWEET